MAECLARGFERLEPENQTTGHPSKRVQSHGRSQAWPSLHAGSVHLIQHHLAAEWSRNSADRGENCSSIYAISAPISSGSFLKCKPSNLLTNFSRMEMAPQGEDTTEQPCRQSQRMPARFCQLILIRNKQELLSQCVDHLRRCCKINSDRNFIFS